MFTIGKKKKFQRHDWDGEKKIWDFTHNIHKHSILIGNRNNSGMKYINSRRKDNVGIASLRDEGTLNQHIKKAESSIQNLNHLIKFMRNKIKRETNKIQVYSHYDVDKREKGTF